MENTNHLKKTEVAPVNFFSQKPFNIPLSSLTTVAINAALRAGETLKEGFYSKFSVETKTGPHDLVTEYDRKAEKIIIDVIREAFPSHSFLGEESGQSGDIENTPFWIIDPIDGTWNFAKQLPSFAISIGCAYRKKMYSSVCFDPLAGELFSAERGFGAMMNGRKLKVSEITDLNAATISLGTRASVEMRKKIGVIRRTGSTVLDLCYIAKGSIEALYDKDLYPWDFAAAMLIIEEAGGQLTQPNGAEVDITQKSDIFACNKVIFKELAQWI